MTLGQSSQCRVTWADRLSSIDVDAWDALSGEQPFLKHAFLCAIEEAGCIGGETGWHASHALLWRDERLVAAMPMYLKDHSWGEYVFDWAWADAYAAHGQAYYPKVLSAVPFTPVSGRRVLAQSPADAAALLDAVLEQVRHGGLSSLHVLFADEALAGLAAQRGMLRRESVQFHWYNRGYAGFDDFLAGMRHDKRKKIRQERRRVADAGVHVRVLAGADIYAADWRFFTRCYRNTYRLHGGTPYLNERFFLLLGERLPAHCVMLLASQAGQDIAASLLLRDDEALYGRYWGAVTHVDCLHFELCYYRPIDFAIAQGLQRFEGGAQGEHKLARGLEPVRTLSLHWLADPRFADAVSRFLAREQGGIAHYVNELEARAPFRAPQ